MIRKIKYVPPKIFHYIFPKTTWKSKVNKILLTFDDGPNPETTPLILKKLNEHSIKAIFFCVGENVEKYHELSNQIIAEGHLIANHTYSHKDINMLAKNVDNSIAKCSVAIENATGTIPKYFRPPHGQIGFFTESIIAKQKLKNVMWSLLTYDYKNNFNIVSFVVDKYLESNSVIVLHDSLKSKLIIEKSIDLIYSTAKEKGFEIGEPLECLK